MSIICTCNAVSKQEIQTVIEAGARTPEQVMVALQAELDCGSCQYYIEDMIEEFLETNSKKI